MVLNLFGKQARPGRRSHRPAPLAVEALDERCLPDANVIGVALPAAQDVPAVLAPPTRFTSEADLRNYFVEQAVKTYGGQFGQPPNTWPYGNYPNGVAYLGAAQAAPGAAVLDDNFTTTNNQVLGVEEGDLVKTDGQYIYALVGHDLVILNAVPAGELRQLSQTHFDGTPAALFLGGNHLTVISSSWSTSGWGGAGDVAVSAYDVSDRSAPTLLQQTTFSNTSYSSARSVGTELYVVLSSPFATPTPQVVTDANGQSVFETEDHFRARVLAEPLDQLLPSYHGVRTGPAGQQQFAGLTDAPSDIYQPQPPSDNQLLSVVRFDETGQQAGPAATVGVFGTGSTTVYASPQNVYLVTSSGYGAQTSEIDKVPLSTDGLAVTAVGSVPGYVVNQFAIDESGAYLRIAASQSWFGPNNLYVLGQDGGLLKGVGKIENLESGERIYSVRFMGDLAYVVTYRQSDPLFTVDLSEPANPHVMGELTMPGFSLYLQMIGSHRLLGFGHDADSYGRTQGLELSLFDTSDLSAPTMVEHISLGAASSLAGWLSSPAELDHHAFLFDAQSGDIVIPVNQSSGGGHLLVFHYDGDSTISYVGQTEAAANVERGLFIDGTLYSVAQDSVRAYDPTDLGRSIAGVPLSGGTSPGQPSGSGFDDTNPNLVQFNEAWGSGYWAGWGDGPIRAWPVGVVVRPQPALLPPAADNAPPRLIPAGVNVVATGSDAGSAPQVKVYNAATHAVLFTPTPFDAHFTGGVRVAVGDVTGTGRPDIVCGAGLGGGPSVAVFRGTDGALLASFFAYDPAMTAGVYVAAGRVAGDGRAAIVTGVGPGGGANVATFVLNRSAGGLGAAELASVFPFGQGAAGGVRVSTEDAGDGHARVLGVAGPGGDPVVSSFDALTGAAVDQAFAADAQGTGLFVAAAG